MRFPSSRGRARNRADIEAHLFCLCEKGRIAHGRLEGAAVDPDVLAQQEDAVVALHLLEDALADRLDVCRRGPCGGLRGLGDADVGFAQVSLRRMEDSASTAPAA